MHTIAPFATFVPMRIIFMGTPEFAVPSLDILVQAGYDIAAVVSAPDKAAGRGRTLQSPPVAVYAQQQGLPLLQPDKLRDPAFVAHLQGLAPDLMVVVAFRMLPEIVWSIPRLGTFNLHASLLPDYRGAAPINWALINGEVQTGLTTFLIDREIDTGQVLLQTAVEIPHDWDAGDLHDAMMQTGAALVLETVRGLGAGTLHARPQDPAQFIHPAPKIFKDDCRIDWQRPAQQLYHFVRGLSPYPAAWTTLDGEMLKVYRAAVVAGREGLAPGTCFGDKNHLCVQCGTDALQLLSLQLAGRKRLDVADFLRGMAVLPGQVV
ncbi:MAG: methionyl-tRNA formyltransferase [Bacteroidia bacterium]